MNATCHVEPMQKLTTTFLQIKYGTLLMCIQGNRPVMLFVAHHVP